MPLVSIDGIVYDDSPSVASIWAIDYEPYYCNICGGFAGYRPNHLHFTGVCSFGCAKKYLNERTEERVNPIK